jgi:ribosomal protein L37AE/L43A
MQWYPHACPTCGGDLHDDLEESEPGWVCCFQCGRSFKKATSSPATSLPALSLAESEDHTAPIGWPQQVAG